MKNQQQIQKKTASPSFSSASSMFRQRPFAPPTALKASPYPEQNLSDLASQIETASHFGHNFSKLQVETNTPSLMLQRQEPTAPRLDQQETDNHLAQRMRVVSGGGQSPEADTTSDSEISSSYLSTPNAIASTQTIAVQREGEDEPNFQLLPPQLQLPLGPLGLTATTSEAQLGYRQSPFSAKLGYEYGGDLFAGMSYRDFSARLGVNPGSGDISLGGSYDQFRFGANASPSGAFGASLGYGSSLLPMPDRLSSTVYAGEAGLRGMLPALPGAINDPLGFYRSQSQNIDAIAGAGSMLGDIASQQSVGGNNFGAGIQLTYDPERGTVIWGGVQANF